MVSALLSDAVMDPTAVLQKLYENCDDTTDFPRAVANHFSEIFLRTQATAGEIPALDVRHPPETFAGRSLVHFRAMVQDTSPSPEMYLAKLKGNRCGGWGISDQMDDDSSSSLDYAGLRECTVVWAVNVPGETAWYTQEAEDSKPTTSSIHRPPQPYKFPIPGADHIGVQVKIYDNDAAHALKTADIVDFVGILTSEQIGSEFDAPIDVPTLHVLFHRHCADKKAFSSYDLVDILALRNDLISWIADEALGGDRDAAEWILLQVIARVQSRNPPLLPPALTISHFAQPDASPAKPTLSHILSEILPLFVTVPLSLERLNKDNFSPESKEENLHSGILQLPQGTTLLLTESDIEEGQLVEKGILNIRAIQDVINSQQLNYVFPFSNFTFPTDLSFIILSEGRKSAFFKTSISIPLQANSSASLYKPKADVRMPLAEDLNSYRRLVGGAKRGTVQVSEETSQYIQNDFVQERQRDKLMTVEDLIHLMTTARLLALSLHEKEVTVDVWKRAKELDARRRARQS